MEVKFENVRAMTNADFKALLDGVPSDGLADYYDQQMLIVFEC